MKTSFYFVIWFVIYPILGLFHNVIIDDNSFFVALIAVFGLSWWLNKMMPKTLQYEQFSQVAPFMENIYTNNVSAFIKRLAIEARLEIFTVIYFLVSTVFFAYTVFKIGVNDWLPLIIFGLFTLSFMARSLKVYNALRQLRKNPTVEQCQEAADQIYQLDYAAYYEYRQQVTYEQMLPPRPPHFKAFQIFSIVIAGLCVLLGCICLFLAATGLIQSHNIVQGSASLMYMLYGTLAVYYGINDFTTIIRALKQPTN